jgi:hypothetical protein
MQNTRNGHGTALIQIKNPHDKASLLQGGCRQQGALTQSIEMKEYIDLHQACVFPVYDNARATGAASEK